MTIKPSDVEAMVEGLSYQDRIRILCNVIWDAFGDVDEAGEPIINRERKPDKVDLENLVEGLRAEFWQEDPDEDKDDGEA